MLTAHIVALLAYTVAQNPGNSPQNQPSSQNQARSASMNGSASRSIEGDALRALLHDAFVTRPGPDGVLTEPAGEVFRENGAYQRIDGRRRLEGRFSIEGNAVCIEGPGFVRQCRRVSAASGGNYVFVDTDDGSSVTMIVSPLQ